MALTLSCGISWWRFVHILTSMGCSIWNKNLCYERKDYVVLERKVRSLIRLCLVDSMYEWRTLLGNVFWNAHLFLIKFNHFSLLYTPLIRILIIMHNRIFFMEMKIFLKEKLEILLISFKLSWKGYWS